MERVGARTIVRIGDVTAGSFRGALEVSVFRHAPLIFVETVVSTEEDGRAILYDAGLVTPTPVGPGRPWSDPAATTYSALAPGPAWKSMAWLDSNGELRRTFAEMERRTRIARIHTHGEKSAAYMADGYARASGKPGVCMAQVIGALNLAAGLRDAWLAPSPVIAMTGGRDPKTKFRKVYQEIDDVPAFEPVTKMNVTIDDVSRIPDMIRQAFRTATTGAPGPVRPHAPAGRA